MLTSEADQQKVLVALEAGADQHLTKPFKATELEETIKKRLSAKKNSETKRSWSLTTLP